MCSPTSHQTRSQNFMSRAMAGMTSDHQPDMAFTPLFLVLPAKDMAGKSCNTDACSRVSHVAIVSARYLPVGYVRSRVFCKRCVSSTGLLAEQHMQQAISWLPSIWDGHYHNTTCEISMLCRRTLESAEIIVEFGTSHRKPVLYWPIVSDPRRVWTFQAFLRE